jgi:hypothetical protein
MAKFSKWAPTAFALTAAASIGSAWAAPPPTKRAKPPQFPQETFDAFFADAREHLVGERPSAKSPQTTPAPTDSPSSEVAAFHWSQLISGDTLATEVKRVAARLREPLVTAARFKAEGHVKCQTEFSQLAVLFAIIAEHDGDVRWQADAAALRDALARAAANCKTGDAATYAEAKARAADLDDLVRGGRLADSAGKPLPADRWSVLADRPQLMQRIQTAYRDRLRPQLADPRQFSKTAVDVRHEAEILAALAEVIHRPQFEYWDDETFIDYARQLQHAAAELSRAAAAQDFNAARAAHARAGQACADCHDGYRL